MGAISCTVSPEDEMRLARSLENKTFTRRIDSNIYEIIFKNSYKTFEYKQRNSTLINYTHSLESMDSNKETTKTVLSLYYTNNNPNALNSYQRNFIEIEEFHRSEHRLFYYMNGDMIIQ